MLNTKVLLIFTINGYQKVKCFLKLLPLWENSTEITRSFFPQYCFGICVLFHLLFLSMENVKHHKKGNLTFFDGLEMPLHGFKFIFLQIIDYCFLNLFFF